MKQKLGWYLRGIAMGAADVVPGVSGGTVAFITGIYERLLAALAAFDPGAWRAFRSGGLGGLWNHVDGTFLALLFAGILTSIVTLASLIGRALDQYPVLVWSFFLGLILASGVHIARRIGRWRISLALALAAGAALAWGLGIIRPQQLPAEPQYFFLAGSVAISAMLLPGISGSFILLLMGMYRRVLEAVSQFSITDLAAFAAGAGIGLIVFTHLLNWLLKRFHEPMLALLTGFLFGSLGLVWPWKGVPQAAGDPDLAADSSAGLARAENLLPADYAALTGQEPLLFPAILCALAGIGLVLVLERVGER